MRFLDVVLRSVVGALVGTWLVNRFTKRRAEPPSLVLEIQELAGRMPEGQLKVAVTRRGSNAIEDIKAIRKAFPRLGLRAAKYIVDHPPQVVCAALTPTEAETLKRQLEATGMVVEVS
jgi:ribosomal protein L7/L12